MKKTFIDRARNSLAVLVGLGFLACAGHANAATVTVGTTTPPVGDGTNYLGDSASGNAGVQFVNNNYLAGDNNSCLGQSFTTGANPAGYALRSISVMQVASTDTYYSGNGALGFRILQPTTPLSSSGVQNITVLRQESSLTFPISTAGNYSHGVLGANAWWVTITLSTNIILQPNTQYGFDIQTPGTGANGQFFMEWNGTSANNFSGGQAFAGGSDGNTPAATSIWLGGAGAGSGDRTFVANMAALSTLTYNGNGSTGGSVPTDGNSPYANGTTVTVQGNGSLAKTGYTFAGWNTAADGSGTSYSGGNTFAISVNTTLYAQWTPIATPPTLTATSAPETLARNQAVTVTATVTPGGGTVTNIQIDTSAIGGSATAHLVLSATPNVWTNTFTVASSTTLGVKLMGLIAYDTTPSTSQQYNVTNTVVATNEVWTGAGSDNNWSTSPNWNTAAPAPAGDAVTFAGTTRLAPNLDSSYSVTGVTFDSTAGSFTIGSSTGSTLTNGIGGIVNNSASAQTLNVPLVLGAAQTFSTVGSLTLNSNVTGSVDLTTTGAGTLTLASAGTSSVGNLQVNAGQLTVSAGAVNVNDTDGFLTQVASNAVVVVSGGSLNIGATNGGGWFPIGTTAGQTATLIVSGGVVNVTNNYGTEIGWGSGSGVLTITSGTFLNNDMGQYAPNGIGLIIGENNSDSGTVNLDGGNLVVNKITRNAATGTTTFNFNGGTLKPTASRTDWFANNPSLTTQVRNGGAIVDTVGFNITLGETLEHSAIGGDSDTDGGLTKVGNGTLTLSGGYYYTGPTKVLSGTLSLNSSLGVPGTGGDLVVSNATLTLDASSGAVMPAANVTLNNGAILNLTNYPYGNAISGMGNLTLSGGTTINLNYGALSGTPTAAINVAGSFSASGTNVINITGSGFVMGWQFPLIVYTGTAVPTNSFRLASLPPGVSAVLVNNAGNSSLDLLIGVAGNTLSWHGANADNSAPLTTWDINTSGNWYDASFNPVAYLQYNGNTVGDNVTFGDNAYDYDQDGTNSVNLPGRVVPSTVTINNTTPYRLAGTGGIDGSTSVVKNNTGSFEIGTSNNYTGGTFVNAGTLAINSDSALGAASGLLTLGGGTVQIAGDMASARLTTLTTNSTVDALAGVTGRLQLNGLITPGSGLSKTGNGTLMLSGTGTNTIGNLLVSQGLLKVTNGTVTVWAGSSDGTMAYSKIDTGGGVEVATGATLTVTNTGTSYFPLGDTSDTTNTLTINGGTVNILNSWGIEVPRQGNAVLTLNSGSMTVNDSVNVGLIIGDQSAAQSGTVNLNGGSLTVNKITSRNGTNTFYLNGGILRPAVAGTFFPASETLTASVRNGGAVVDTTTNNVTIGQALVHSAVGGDNAVDGGLTKQGSGILTLTGTNSYTGNTIVNGGTLVLGQAVPVLATNSTVSIAAGAVLHLDTSVVTNQVAGLVTNGVAAGNGLYNSANGSGYIAGPGYLQVGPFPTGPDLTQNQLTNSITGGGTTLSLSWSPGWKLQAQTNSLTTGLSGNWVTITDGTATSTNLPIVPGNPSVFYRLINQ